jgi:hypothetical protein
MSSKPGGAVSQKKNKKTSRLRSDYWKKWDRGFLARIVAGIQSSRHSIMRELRVQHKGRPYRVLYAFDPRRVAMLLIGGDKTGDDAWYDRYVPVAERIYDEHLIAIEKEGSKDD